MSAENKFKSLDEEFEFYVGFTKPFVMNKENSEDRALAAVWIKKLMREGDKGLRLDYLKLLLFALQKPALIGPFKQLPPRVLEPLPEGQSIFEIISVVMDNTNYDKGDSHEDQPPVAAAVSHDLTEYAAVQTITNFGLHCFYATSPVSINQWHTPEQYILPTRHCHGAEAWEQGLSQLYHADLYANFFNKNKTPQTKSKDPCADDKNEETVKENIKCEINKKMFKYLLANRGPKSPWASAVGSPPCNHQTQPRNKFRWDKFSRLDSSYNAQPSSNLHQDCTLNDKGSTLFQTDQIAILLANENKQKKNAQKNRQNSK